MSSISEKMRFARENPALAVQKALNTRGFSVKEDGKYGPETKAAIEAFQRQNKLTVDGIAGNATKRALGIFVPEAVPSPAPPQRRPNQAELDRVTAELKAAASQNLPVAVETPVLPVAAEEETNWLLYGGIAAVALGLGYYFYTQK